MSEFVARYWAHKSQSTGEAASPALQSVASRAWNVIDYLPARLTSLGFAVVGSFEDAIDGWRNYMQRLPGASENRNDGLIMAATSGAVNVRLGGVALKAAFAPEASQGFQSSGVETGSPATESTPGREPEVAHLRSIVGLVWRSVVLWMVLLALLTLARLLG